MFDLVTLCLLAGDNHTMKIIQTWFSRFELFEYGCFQLLGWACNQCDEVAIGSQQDLSHREEDAILIQKDFIQDDEEAFVESEWLPFREEQTILIQKWEGHRT